MKAFSALLSLACLTAFVDFSAATATSASSECVAYGPNLLSGGNFDEPLFSGGWKLSPAFNKLIASIEGNITPRGLGSLVFDFTKGLGSKCELHHGLFTLPGDVSLFKISGQIKKEAGCKAACILKGLGGIIKSFEFGEEAIDDWETFEFIFSPISRTYNLQLLANGLDGITQFDDIEIRRCYPVGSLVPDFVDNCGSCLLKDPNFNEHGSWEGSDVDYVPCPKGRFGKRCAHLKRDDVVRQTIPCHQNGVYRVSGAFIGEKGCSLSLQVEHGGKTEHFAIQHTDEDRDGRQVFKHSFESKFGGDAIISVIGGSDSPIHLDFISVARVDCHSLKSKEHVSLPRQRRQFDEL